MMIVDFWEQAGVLKFSGPDAVRFLNGQVTQDVRKVAESAVPLPACVTDAKGKLMFRVWLAAGENVETVLVFCPKYQTEALEARLTRYLIADDVEVADVSEETDVGRWDFPNANISEEDRIKQGIPKWGAELVEGMLPPEARLDDTDISYAKGCYIGQEVISRIKSAKKVNRYLTKFTFDQKIPCAPITNAEGKVVGEITSVGEESALGYLKRTADSGAEMSVNGISVQVISEV